METKQCRKCKEVKQVTEFSKSIDNRDNKVRLKCYCKICSANILREYRKQNKDKRIKYYNDNKEKILQKQRERYKKNKDKIKQYSKEYYKKNKDKIDNRTKKYYYKTKEIRKSVARKWRVNNKEKYKHYQNEYMKIRKKKDFVYYLKKTINSRIRTSLVKKGFTKRSRTHEILGCSFEEFKLHIERQFLKGMTWENRDKWHIDHIIPMATAKTEEDVIRLNHYTNLRPLWAEENLSKSDKIVTHQLVLL